MELLNMLLLLLGATLVASSVVDKEGRMLTMAGKEETIEDEDVRDLQERKNMGARCSAWAFEHAFVDFPMVSGPACDRITVVRRAGGCSDVVEHVCTGVCPGRDRGEQCCEGVDPWAAKYYVEGQIYYAKRYRGCRCRYVYG